MVVQRRASVPRNDRNASRWQRGRSADDGEPYCTVVFIGPVVEDETHEEDFFFDLGTEDVVGHEGDPGLAFRRVFLPELRFTTTNGEKASVKAKVRANFKRVGFESR